MIYTIVGTHVGIREKASKELLAHGEVTSHIYSEQINELEKIIDASSLFGDAVISMCIQLSNTAASKEVLVSFLKRMEASPNIFIIDEPFADVHLVTKLTKVSKKLFDAREEKKKDTSLFMLADAFVARDKKSAWVLFMGIRGNESGESIQGVLWWKFQTEWKKVKDGKRSPFSIDDCERIGRDLVCSSIKAHRGELDLMIELERIILSL